MSAVLRNVNKPINPYCSLFTIPCSFLISTVNFNFGKLLMTSVNTNLYLFLENLAFFIVATGFTAIVGWAWRNAKPFSIPEPLPGWFKIWFGTVQVTYLYLPYRLWQLYEGLTILSSDSELIWVRLLLIVEIFLWIGNYLLDLAQLPRLFRWDIQEG